VDRVRTPPYTHQVNPAENTENLLQALRKYWGYDSFRPLQEKIVRSLLGGHDTCVIMPTGGGKSLCYQLPAAILSSQTVIVISPLLALMQDQVAQLSQAGIPAVSLNSSVANKEQAAAMKDAQAGAYRLLYLSPERLARPDTVEWLRGVPISFIAIDEAHCISEWGHEFRPEYRQLSALREHFPKAPIAAFTASATRQVRHDIVEQLKLRNPHKYIASFHRPNLNYIVKACDSETQQALLVRTLRRHEGASAIVYAPTIARVGQTAAFLESEGIAAVPYHGQMDAQTRRTNQERWMSDEVRVLVGTIAFGLGINKASVRAVIHLSLPKSIEQYYQEAGRAGRDGRPADCLMLWQKRDAGLLAHFIQQLSDPEERDRGWKRYHAVRDFVENDKCRHEQICVHFGEVAKWKTCEACDACRKFPWLEESVPEPPRAGKKTVKAGAGVLVLPRSNSANEEEVDSELFERLRQWRLSVAQEQKVPAFVVFHDSTLEAICRRSPGSIRELREVSGIGEKKCERYGQQILEILAEFSAR
jgi:ATP-dependent DNA helicase RecQ